VRRRVRVAIAGAGAIGRTPSVVSAERNGSSSMKVVVCWSHVSGYMAACWRALAATPDCEVFVVAFGPEGDAPFDPAVMRGG
jgi:hypothetical protein